MHLLNLEDAMNVYKYFFVRNPKFGIDLFRSDTIIEDVLVLEKNINLKKNIPIKFDFYALLLCVDGELTRNVNQYSYAISKHSLQLIQPNTIYSFENITDTTEIYILLFSESYIKMDKENHVIQNIEDLFDYHNSNLRPIQLSTSTYTRIFNLYGDINSELQEKQDGYHSLIRLIIIKLLIILKREKNSQYTTRDFSTRGEQLAYLYLDLIEKYFSSHTKVADYAKILDVTPKHLGETVKEILNRSALSCIHHRITKEALYLLEYTNLSISQIASTLSFQSPSEFSRFFKSHYKITPKAFRLGILHLL